MASAGVVVYCATKAGREPVHRGTPGRAQGHAVSKTTLVEIGPVATEMMDHLRDYAPTAASVRRLERAGLSPELDPTTSPRRSRPRSNPGAGTSASPNARRR